MGTEAVGLEGREQVVEGADPGGAVVQLGPGEVGDHDIVVARAAVGVVGDHEGAVGAAADVELAVVGADPRRVGDPGEGVLVPADRAQLGVPAAVGGDQNPMAGHEAQR